MKRCLLLLALLGLFLAGTPLVAAPPTLSLPAKVSGLPGAFLQVPATTDGKNVAWLALDPGLNLFPTNLLKDTHTAVVTSGTPGTYRLLAVTASGDEISAPAVCQVVIEGAAPPAPAPPSPGPTPPAPTPPTPTPAPAAKAAWAIVIVDNAKRTPGLGLLLSSPTLAAALQNRGVSYRVLPVDDPTVAANNYAAAVQAAGGAPALLVYAADGTRLKAVPLPVDEAAFLAAIPAASAAFTPLCPTCQGGFCPK